LNNRAEINLFNRVKVRGRILIVHPSPSQRLSLRGRSPSGAEPEPAATITLPPAYRQAGIKGEGNDEITEARFFP
jgi:hypothetical protein